MDKQQFIEFMREQSKHIVTMFAIPPQALGVVTPMTEQDFETVRDGLRSALLEVALKVALEKPMRQHKFRAWMDEAKCMVYFDLFTKPENVFSSDPTMD